MPGGTGSSDYDDDYYSSSYGYEPEVYNRDKAERRKSYGKYSLAEESRKSKDHKIYDDSNSYGYEAAEYSSSYGKTGKRKSFRNSFNRKSGKSGKSKSDQSYQPANYGYGKSSNKKAYGKNSNGKNFFGHKSGKPKGALRYSPANYSYNKTPKRKL